MNPRDRRIRRLRLACQREEHASRGRTLLEDALRTASLGDEGRVVVIRSLHLGRLSPHASATEWSLRLEQHVRAAQTAAVFAETSAAISADAVWFPNEIELWVALALRAARGAPLHEWFWGPAATGWSPRLTAPEMLRLAFQRIAAAGGWPATFVLARRLVRIGVLAPLLRSLSAEDVRPLLSGNDERSSAPPDEPVSDDARAEGPDAPADKELIESADVPGWNEAWQRTFIEIVGELPPVDLRLTWLAAAALFAEAAVPPSQGEMHRVARRALRQWFRARAVRSAPPTLSSPRRFEPTRTASSPRPDEAQSHVAPVSKPVGGHEGVLTSCGGLFFLVPLFVRLGIAESPDASRGAWQALRLVFERCRRSPQDELGRWLPDADEPAPAPFVLPRIFAATRGVLRLSRWRGNWRVLLDATGRLPLAAWPRGTTCPARELLQDRPLRRGENFPRDLDPLAAALALGAHRLARRECGLGLKTLVRRPARVAITDTHVNLFFRLHEADVRIRRAALDLDPGWVPWLGRVVSFH
ncbi:MAG TPA: hypothetical protein VI454_18870, partial [Verrucomicrobiae bacterium]